METSSWVQPPSAGPLQDTDQVGAQAGRKTSVSFHLPNDKSKDAQDGAQTDVAAAVAKCVAGYENGIGAGDGKQLQLPSILSTIPRPTSGASKRASVQSSRPDSASSKTSKTILARPDSAMSKKSSMTKTTAAEVESLVETPKREKKISSKGSTFFIAKASDQDFSHMSIEERVKLMKVSTGQLRDWFQNDAQDFLLREQGTGQPKSGGGKRERVRSSMSSLGESRNSFAPSESSKG